MPPFYVYFCEHLYRLLSHLTPFNVWSHFQTLQRNQWLSYDQLCILRWQKLKQLLEFTYHTIPFYRKLWQSAGVNPERFRTEKDMVNLPVITKKELIEAQKNDEFLLSKKRGFEMAYTSGTTGERFEVPFTFTCYQKKYANHLRQVYACGWRLGTKSAAIHYSGHNQFKGKYSGRQGDREPFMGLRETALKLFHRRKILPPYNEVQTGDDAQVALWYDALRAYKPYMLETMDYVLPMLQEYIERNGLQPLHIPKIYVLGTYSRALRERLGNFFSSEIFNRFSPHEIEGVAFACNIHLGMHMAIDSYHVEFLNEKNRPVGPEETGFIVVTDLDNYLMPLIRYKLGDLGHYYTESCPCGRGLPLMGDIDGRACDLFVLKNRSLVPPAKIAAVFQNVPEVLLFQIVQDLDRKITAYVVPVKKPLRNEIIVTIKNELHKLLGEEESLTIKESDHINLEPNGKCSFVKRIVA